MPKITMKAARVSAGLTQEEIASKMGVSRGWVLKIENGATRAKPVYLLAWCQITGFRPEDIILPENIA